MAKNPKKNSQPTLREQAEQRLQENSADLKDLPPEETQRLLYELRVHQVELEMQNDELREAHTRLETAHDRYADLYDFAPVGYLTLSEAGRIEEANLTVAGWLGLERKKLVGQAFTGFIASPDQDTAYRHYQALLETGETQYTEIRLMKQDRSVFYVRLDSALRTSDSRQPRQIRTTIVDITGRRRAEEALHKTQIARDLAEESTRMKSKFLAMVSHELRTPLASIKGFTSTLLGEDIKFDPEQQREFLTIINQETDSLTELVEQLLNLSQLQAGALKITKSPVSLQAIFSLGMPQFNALTRQHELKLPTSLDFPLIMADPVRIAQVIINLISNAVKYSPRNSTITLSISHIDRFIQLSVSDEGSGIPVEERDIVFQAFEQLETRSRVPTGVGLGLAICRSLVEAHDGRIWIEDRAGPGTTVSFSLPLVPSQNESDDERQLQG